MGGAAGLSGPVGGPWLSWTPHLLTLLTSLCQNLTTGRNEKNKLDHRVVLRSEMCFPQSQPGSRGSSVKVIMYANVCKFTEGPYPTGSVVSWATVLVPHVSLASCPALILVTTRASQTRGPSVPGPPCLALRNPAERIQPLPHICSCTC